MIRPLIKAHLEADSTLATLIQDRVYSVKAPDGAQRPYVVFKNVGDNRSTRLPGYQVMRLQFNVYPATVAGQFPKASPHYGNAQTIARALRAAIASATEASTEAVCIQQITLGTMVDTDYDPDNVYGVMLDVLVTYRG